MAKRSAEGEVPLQEPSPGHSAQESASGRTAAGGKAELQRGCRVRLLELKAAPHHNGATGVVLTGPNDRGRWEVELARTLSLLPANLEVKASPFGVVLQKGARVLIKGLKTEQHFNGVTGTVASSCQNSKGRWQIDVRTKLALKTENLEVLQPPQSSGAPHPPSKKARIRKGSMVLISDLKSSPEFNGLWGQVMNQGKDGRWLVQLDYRRELRVLALKPDHLIPENEPEAMPADLWRSDDEDEVETQNAKTPNRDHPGTETQRADFWGSDDDFDVGETKSQADGQTGEEGSSSHEMPPVDHACANYEDVQMNSYEEHGEISQLSDEEVTKYRAELALSVTGSEVARPICAWAHLALPEAFLKVLQSRGMSQPTRIQRQSLPCALQGRDVVGVAPTGGGKTLAYIIPLLIHVQNQRKADKKEGPIGLIVAPTRELAMQIGREASRFASSSNLRSIVLAGGLSKQEQCVRLRHGVEVAICNPGRFIDLARKKNVTCARTTCIVLDEADRLLDAGFRTQVLSILRSVRPLRQMLLFTATMPSKLKTMISELTQRPIWMNVCDTSRAGSATTTSGDVPQGGVQNESIVQERVVELENDTAKWTWLVANIDKLLEDGQLLVFANTRATVSDVADRLQKAGYSIAALHGDLQQDDRITQLGRFRRGDVKTLVATDVAARGLDILSIHTVLSYDKALTPDNETHRLGRAGRAGRPGSAVTLVTRQNT